MRSTAASSEFEEALGLAVKDFLRNYVQIGDGELSNAGASIMSIPSNIIVNECNKSKIEEANASEGEECTDHQIDETNDLKHNPRKIFNSTCVTENENTKNGLEILTCKEDARSLREENVKLKLELKTYEDRLTELQLKIDCQRFELAKLNKKVTKKPNSESTNDKMLAETVHIRLLEEYKMKVSELEKKTTLQRNELAKLNKKVYEQATREKNKRGDSTEVKVYEEIISELQKKIDRQREELKNCNKKKEKESAALAFIMQELEKLKGKGV